METNQQLAERVIRLLDENGRHFTTHDLRIDARELATRLLTTTQPTSDEGTPLTDAFWGVTRSDKCISYRSVSAEEAIEFCFKLEARLNHAEKQWGECTGGYETLERTLHAKERELAERKRWADEGFAALQENQRLRTELGGLQRQLAALPSGYVQVPRFLAENFLRSTDVPRFKRILEEALAATPTPSDSKQVATQAKAGFEALYTDALVEALKTLYEETADYIRINNLGPVHHNRSMQLARDALIAQGALPKDGQTPQSGKKEDGWISVDERLPEIGQEVLCAYQDYECVTVGDQDMDKWTLRMFNGEGNDGFIECYAIAYGSRSYVTHWMPLPSPPASKAGESK